MPIVVVIVGIYWVIGVIDAHDVLHTIGLRHGFIGDALKFNDFAIEIAAICGDYNLGLCVHNPRQQRLGGQTAVYDRMYATDFGASQHCNRLFRDARHVNRDAVAFFHA